MYDNIVVLSADRNGSTAFMEHLKTEVVHNLNGDYNVWLNECFSQDSDKNQPPHWWDPHRFPPSDVIDAINKGTGKRVILKLQITWPLFNKSYYDINAGRKIFLHRNLFDSTLSRCIALKTGYWFTFKHGHQSPTNIAIEPEFFEERFSYRLERYTENLGYILDWCNEWHRYDEFNYDPSIMLKPNPDKRTVVDNYDQLYQMYGMHPELTRIDEMINERLR